MDVDDLYVGIHLEVFAEFGDIDIHASRSEIAVVLPDFLEGAATVHKLVEVHGKHAQEFAFLHGETLHLVALGEGLMREIKRKVANVEGVLVGLSVVESAADGGIEAGKKFFHAEGLGDVVVGTYLKPLQLVGLKVLGRQEYDWDALVYATDFLSHSESILYRHHNVENTRVDIVILVSIDGCLAVGCEGDGIAFLRKIGLEYGAEIGIILCDEEFNT